MSNLPYIIPEDALELNLLLIFFVVQNLSSTVSGKLILNNERLMIYTYLIQNPHILNRLLIKLSKKSFVLKSYESSSFKAENMDVESLYKNDIIKFCLQILISKNLIQVKYEDKIGFVYIANTTELEMFNNTQDKYINRVKNFIEKIKQINSTPVSRISTMLKNILNEGI